MNIHDEKGWTSAILLPSEAQHPQKFAVVVSVTLFLFCFPAFELFVSHVRFSCIFRLLLVQRGWRPSDLFWAETDSEEAPRRV